MINVIFISHGGFAEGLVDGARMIVGESEGVMGIGLYPEDDIKVFTQKVTDACVRMGEGADAVLVLVDLFGASPANAALNCLRPEIAAKVKIACIAGMNMPMALEALVNREGLSAEELSAMLVEAGRAGVIDLKQAFQSVSAKDE